MIRDLLAKMGEEYAQGQHSEATHIAKIEWLANHLSAQFTLILDGGRFRIGVAQKILNLYLKYRWTLGWNPEPFHCPFDSKVISKLTLNRPIAWTSFDSLEDYKALVDAAKRNASQQRLTIAQWELELWSGNQ